MARRHTPPPGGLILGVRPIFLIALGLSAAFCLWMLGTMLMSLRAVS
jgi:hypothetical protein